MQRLFGAGQPVAPERLTALQFVSDEPQGFGPEEHLEALAVFQQGDHFGVEGLIFAAQHAGHFGLVVAGVDLGREDVQFGRRDAARGVRHLADVGLAAGVPHGKVGAGHQVIGSDNSHLVLVFRIDHRQRRSFHRLLGVHLAVEGGEVLRREVIDVAVNAHVASGYLGAKGGGGVEIERLRLVMNGVGQVCAGGIGLANLARQRPFLLQVVERLLGHAQNDAQVLLLSLIHI